MKTVCYVMCPGHSGSTLVGNALGSHPSCFHVGELVAPIAKRKAAVCRYCGSDCPIWGRLISERDALNLYTEFQDWRSSRKSSLRKTLLGDHNSIYRAIFREYPAVSTLIDSSKDVAWTQFNASRRYRFRFLFLRRDLRAYFNSMNRSYGTLRDDQLVADLKSNVNGLRKLYSRLSNEEKLVVDYERLVSEPERTLREISGWLGLEYDNRMMEFYRFPQHLIGGNPSLVVQSESLANPGGLSLALSSAPSERSRARLLELAKTRGFQHDDTWKHELSDSDMAYVMKRLSSGDLETVEAGGYVYYAL